MDLAAHVVEHPGVQGQGDDLAGDLVDDRLVVLDGDDAAVGEVVEPLRDHREDEARRLGRLGEEQLPVAQRHAEEVRRVARVGAGAEHGGAQGGAAAPERRDAQHQDDGASGHSAPGGEGHGGCRRGGGRGLDGRGSPAASGSDEALRRRRVGATAVVARSRRARRREGLPDLRRNRHASHDARHEEGRERGRGATICGAP